MKQREREFSVVLTEAVHEGLSHIGPSIPSVVFFVMQKDGSIESDRRIDDLEAFEEGLKRMFGFGAKVIEKKILEVLYMKLEVPKEIKDDFIFAEEVKSAQRLLDSIDLATTETH